MTFVLIGISAHPLWIGLIFAYFIGYRWHITPITNYCRLLQPTSGPSPADRRNGPITWFCPG